MKRYALLAGAATVALAMSLTAAPLVDDTPSVDDIRQWQQSIWAHYRSLNAEGDIDQAAFNEYVVGRLDELDLDELYAAHLEIVMGFITMAGEKFQQKFDARLRTLRERDDAEGAHAAGLFITREMRQPGGIQVATVREALSHPGLESALEGGQIAGLMRTLDFLSEEVLEEVSDRLIAVLRAIDVNTDPNVIASSVNLITALNKTSVEKATRDQLRTHVANLCREAAARVKDDPEMQHMASHLERQSRFITSAFARGELIDHTAPKIEFTWFSGDQNITQLSDLQGKVVVLDFWATWCGPCISSFPNVRELQEHYHGYDVVILGVTSLQGRHYPGDGAPIDTEGDPEKEYELMAEFMQAKEMTWPVAFSTDDVFNPEYGVRGIPHVAIIDTTGKVRHNGLHPAGPMASKVEMINALLKEAELPAPPPPVAQDINIDADAADGDDPSDS